MSQVPSLTPMNPPALAPMAPTLAPMGGAPAAPVAGVATLQGGVADLTPPAGTQDAQGNAVAGGQASGAAGQVGADGQPVTTKKRRTSTRTKFRADDTAPKLDTGDVQSKGYSFSKHLPLGKDDFADEALYWDYKADTAERSARKHRQTADQIRAGGSPESRKNLAKVSKALEAFNNTRKQLIETFGEAKVNEMLAGMAAQAGFILPGNGQAGPAATGQPVTPGVAGTL
jgi:hypothetical protein